MGNSNERKRDKLGRFVSNKLKTDERFFDDYVAKGIAEIEWFLRYKAQS